MGRYALWQEELFDESLGEKDRDKESVPHYYLNFGKIGGLMNDVKNKYSRIYRNINTYSDVTP